MKNRIIEIGVKEGISSRAHGFSDGHHNHELYGLRPAAPNRTDYTIEEYPLSCGGIFIENITILHYRLLLSVVSSSLGWVIASVLNRVLLALWFLPLVAETERY